MLTNLQRTAVVSLHIVLLCDMQTRSRGGGLTLVQSILLVVAASLGSVVCKGRGKKETQYYNTFTYIGCLVLLTRCRDGNGGINN